MALTDLADEGALRARIDELLGVGASFAVLAAHMELPDAAHTAPLETVAARVSGLVRGADLLGLVEPSTLVLIGSGMDADGVKLVTERVQEAVGLPVEMEGQVVSLLVDQSSVVVQPGDAVPGVAPGLGERRAQSAAVPAPRDGAAVLDQLLAQLSA